VPPFVGGGLTGWLKSGGARCCARVRQKQREASPTTCGRCGVTISYLSSAGRTQFILFLLTTTTTPYLRRNLGSRTAHSRPPSLSPVIHRLYYLAGSYITIFQSFPTFNAKPAFESPTCSSLPSSSSPSSSIQNSGAEPASSLATLSHSSSSWKSSVWQAQMRIAKKSRDY
jgi:hypothetical protein